MTSTTPYEDFAGKSVIVTGAARGIGFAIASRFLQGGANVAIVDVAQTALSAAIDSLPDTSRKATLPICASVSDAGDVAHAVNLVRDTFGSVDILVNNAGISPKHNGRKATVEEMQLEEWRQVIDVNLTGAFLYSKACLPHMRARQWGRIINIGSQAGRTRPDFAGAHYAASKAGLMALARTLAVEVGPFGITVNSLAPGRIETPMLAEAGQEANEAYLGRIPVGRIGSGEDVAAAIAYLASAQAAFVTGITLDINGGAFMI
ncbi:SDR family oxidoreductase [Rhizobium sp.]